MPPDCDDPSQAWVEEVLSYDLAPSVPITVRRLFEIARGTLVYSLMYYPLLTLGSEQLMRVQEAAAAAKCKALGAPENQTSNFDRQIRWLVKKRKISASDETPWHAARQLRNHASHPTDQSIFDPTMAISMLAGSVELISALFGS